MPRPVYCSLAILGLLVSLATPVRADERGGPSILDYGWTGLSAGLGIGLASGYLAIGDTYQQGEWRAFAYGAGVGGLSGLGVGLILGLADVSAAPQRPGFIVLRDLGYGATIGSVGGLIVGALFAIGENGELRDLTTGAAYGTLIGAGVGAIFGVVEASIRGAGSGSVRGGHEARQLAKAPNQTLRFTLASRQDAGRRTVLMPTLYGHF